MPVSFTTCPFEVTAGRNGSIMIEDRKTGQSWHLSNRQTRQFVRLIGDRRRFAEQLEYHRNFRGPGPNPGE
jgi:hypothetical protein